MMEELNPEILQVWIYWQGLSEPKPSLDVTMQQLRPPGKILVTSPTYRCFENWCHKVGISKRAPMLRFASETRQLYGWDPSRTFILSLCPWQPIRKNEDWHYTIQYLRKAGMQFESDECIEGGRGLERERRTRDRRPLREPD